MASIPRPSRPSLNPPTGPLPSIPVSKSRQSIGPSTDKPNGIPSPASGLPQPTAVRTASSPNVPTTSSSLNGTQNNSSNTPNANSSQNSPPSAQSKTVRKTLSSSSFPKPPAAEARSPSVQSSSSSRNTTPRSSARGSNLYTNGLNRAGSTAGSTRLSGASFASAANSVPVKDVDPAEAIAEDADESAVDDSKSTTDESPRGRPTSTTKEKGNVIISVRVKPEVGGSDGTPGGGEWMVDGRQSLVSYRGREGGEYYYDNVFTTHDKNAKVYDSAAKRLVRRVMEGYHGNVFAYGMTGTGKTFSMQGTATSPGVIPLAITDIFSYIRETPHREFLLRVSYLEIYNEKINDLLATPIGPGQGTQTQEEIKLREDSKRGVYATPLKEEIVQSPTQLLRVIARGDHARRTSTTQYNVRSSRSHAVVQIVVESRERNAAAPAGGENKRAPMIPGGVRVSTLSLIDLAGSERAADDKERQKEGSHINKSLLTLGNVISRLSGKKDKQGNQMDKDGKHLPYRDSKLTRLLQSALSGNSLISILCTIQLGSTNSSAALGNHTGETLNTLKFAARARNNIVSHAKKAEEAYGGMGDAGSRALLDRYRIEIASLRKQLEEQKVEKEKVKDEEQEKEKEKEKEQEQEHEVRHEEQMLEMQLARTALKERIEHLNRLILSSKSIGVNAGRSFSSLSLTTPNRTSRTSLRSSASTQTLGEQSTYRTSSGSMNAFATQNLHSHNLSGTERDLTGASNFDEEEESYADTGDGMASLTAQVRNLQADLADKNRYISTLEKRLIQARRSSRSRMSMSFMNRDSYASNDSGGAEALLREKDAEIAELRERLDDKDRMVAALRSAARARDTADASSIASFDTAPGSAHPDANYEGSEVDGVETHRRISPGSLRGLNSRFSSGSLAGGRSSIANDPVHRASPVAKLLQMNGNEGTAPSNAAREATTSPTRRAFGPTSPTAGTRPISPRNHGVDEMTRMLDDMIRQKVESDNSRTNSARNSKRNSLIMTRNGSINGGGGGTAVPSSTPASARGSIRVNPESGRLSGWETAAGNTSTQPRQLRHSRAFPNGTPPGTTDSTALEKQHRRSSLAVTPGAAAEVQSAPAHRRNRSNPDDAKMQSSTAAALQATAALQQARRVQSEAEAAEREEESSDASTAKEASEGDADADESSEGEPTLVVAGANMPAPVPPAPTPVEGAVGV